MNNKKKLLFITGTRADYGKLKPLIRGVEDSYDFEAFIYVSGMHLLALYGSTYEEVLKDNYKNTHVAFGLISTQNMSYDLGTIICNLTGYVNNIKPDMIVVHGDRIDALAGAVVGALNNILVAHIEGGELSGSIDESIRHAVSKLSHLHFVSNQEACNRLLQLGEEKERVFIIGSPDIDIMISQSLPTLYEAKTRYDILFEKYSILMYHPVTTEISSTGHNVKELMDAVLASKLNYIIIYPNNDHGSEIILEEYRKLGRNQHFAIYPSIRFEYFLTLLKHTDFIIGNSSAGIREACIYGTPSIDIGSRQADRYSLDKSLNIQHVQPIKEDVIHAIHNASCYRQKNQAFGDGNSAQKFMQILNDEYIWRMKIQKRFIDWDY